MAHRPPHDWGSGSLHMEGARHRRERREEEGPEWRDRPGQRESSESVESRIQAGLTEDTRGEMGVTKRSERI